MVGFSESCVSELDWKEKRKKIKVDYPEPRRNILGHIVYGVSLAIFLFTGIIDFFESFVRGLFGIMFFGLWVVYYPYIFRGFLKDFPRITTIILVFFIVMVILEYNIWF